ncbi:hypothetical protein [Caloranaerobacter sp. DY30410]|uniref:hypothetical protein n=1 Tax=Caloranaerobacter sp. DY30410 TaxID=3238305 RepID=UPI003D06CD58
MVKHIDTGENNVLNLVVKQYLESHDFNGLPYYYLEYDARDEICKLIDEDKVEIYSSKYEINPHIKRLKQYLGKDKQKEEVINNPQSIVLYPTENYLKTLNLIEERPFTKMLMEGRPQLEILYFKVEVLESYYQDPRYTVLSHDYRGKIYVNDDYRDELEGEYLKDFGLGYHKDKGNNDRVIGAFIGDLADLSLNAQLKWKIHYIPNQEDYKINYSFYKNTILGQWVDEVSIYDALLEEMIVINKMCENMGIPKLFKKTIKPHGYDKPEDYRIILLPTLKNYYSFILTLEKMIVHNINTKTFIKEGFYVKPIDRNDKKGEPKGSLVMFSEWLKNNIRTSEDLDELIINPLKKIRKIRQVPAHEMYSNKYDKSLYRKQNELIIETYKAIRAIRLFFMNHPLNKDMEISEYLITGEKIVVY